MIILLLTSTICIFLLWRYLLLNAKNTLNETRKFNHCTNFFIFFFIRKKRERRNERFARSRLIVRLLDRECSNVRGDITWQVTTCAVRSGHCAFHGIVNHDSPHIFYWKASKNSFREKRSRSMRLAAFAIVSLLCLYFSWDVLLQISWNFYLQVLKRKKDTHTHTHTHTQRERERERERERKGREKKKKE